MKDLKWKQINIDMIELEYMLSKIDNPYTKASAKERLAIEIQQQEEARSKDIKYKS